MLLLVMGSNYLMMFIGWEGVGLCSYLLIGFWFKNDAYNDAAQKAFVMNRIGDLGFLLGMFFILFHFGTLDIQTVKDLAPGLTANSTLLIGITHCCLSERLENQHNFHSTPGCLTLWPDLHRYLP